MKKAVYYSRVSTAAQEEQKTIESQNALLKDIITKSGNLLVDEFMDEGWSGETLDRAELSRLREAAKNGEFEVMYIYHLDRISRDLGNQLYVIAELKRLGIEIYTAIGKLEDDPNSRLLMQVHGMVAEQEKLRIQERTTRGKLQKAKRGVVVGSIAPYGYSYIKVDRDKHKDGYYVINEKEAVVVRNIYNWFLELESIRSVQKKLLEEGVKTTNGSDKWGKSTIHRILTREDYVGVAHYNKHQSVETKSGRERKFKKIVRTGRKLRDKKEWIPIVVPQIIEQSEFNRVQGLLEKNRNSKRRTTDREYLLTGLIRCASCDSPYAGNPHKNYLSYRCTNRIKTFPLPKTCTNSMVKTDIIDNAVWNSVSEALKDPRIVTERIKRITDKHNASLGDTQPKIEAAKQKIKDLKAASDRYLDLYGGGHMTKEELLERMNGIKADSDKHLDNIQKWESLANEKIDRNDLKKGIRQFCKLYGKNTDAMSFEARKRLLGRIVKGVSLNTEIKSVTINVEMPLEGLLNTIEGGLSSTTY